ncbi:diguanylate cyclase [Stutzerimonas stutzeri]|uniref:Diguanylate cyclase n=1 Tax=Stutzerimonas stutzeri TaxID=316 RepID=W8RFZ6_STUST|nr:DinB family protein [Stutzerimonas stutzeri]AHL77452.1 diguanylate cyclase [Stutzerimonas stutzeri]MCQ4330350.1 DinB family protein [Stutzerimonas stutzeri]
MSLKEHFELLASYNQWMNSKIYEAAGQLGADELAKDRRAFFGSILGTLNHILIADIIWLKRFATPPCGLTSLREIVELPDPSSLDQMLFEDFAALSEQRFWLDRQICNWINELSEDDLDLVLSYHNTKGVPGNKRLSSLALHFFNHQTHHRGQVTTLLSQVGKSIEVTDLLVLIPEEDPI